MCCLRDNRRRTTQIRSECPNHTLTCPALTGGVSPAIPTMSYTIVAEQRRALEILAAAGLRGCTGATLLAHGFSVDMIADLVHDGLATARCETVRVGKRKIKVARIRIADAGQRALEG